jgi:hypothetical protein
MHVLLRKAAWGLALPDLRRVVECCKAQPAAAAAAADQEDDDYRRRWQEMQAKAVHSAVSSPTPDWAGKAGWLLGEWGMQLLWDAVSAWDGLREAMGRPDAAQRLAWLRERGLLTSSIAREATSVAYKEGNAAALLWLLEGGAAAAPTAQEAAEVAERGHLAVLQLLHRRGCPLAVDGSMQDVFRAAAHGGHVAVLEWLEATLFPQGLPPPGQHPLVPDTMTAAIHGCSLPAMRWLAERGCPLNSNSWVPLHRCSMEAVGWLLERRCPLPVVAASTHPCCCCCYTWTRPCINQGTGGGWRVGHSCVAPAIGRGRGRTA